MGCDNVIYEGRVQDPITDSVMKAQNAIFLTTMNSTNVENFGVGITVIKVLYTRFKFLKVFFVL